MCVLQTSTAGFTPTNNVVVAPNTTSQTFALSLDSNSTKILLQCFNTGFYYVALGDATVTVDTTTGFSIALPQLYMLALNGATHIAVISTTISVSNLHYSVGY